MEKTLRPNAKKAFDRGDCNGVQGPYIPAGTFLNLFNDYGIGTLKRNRGPLYPQPEEASGFVEFTKENVKAALRGYQNPDKMVDPSEAEFEGARLRLKVDYVRQLIGRDFDSIGASSIINGPSFAKTEKKRFQLGFLNKFGITDNRYRLKCTYDTYNDIFPYDHLFPWREDDPKDILNSFKPVEPDRAMLSLFRRKLKELLADLKEPDGSPIVGLGTKGGTSVCNEKEKFRGYAKMMHNESEYDTQMHAKRSIIRVDPANTRDAIKLSQKSINSVARISQLFGQIVNQLKNSSMRASPEEEQRRALKAQRALSYFGYSYVRDFKKSGLTFPKPVLTSIKDCVQAKWPHLDLSYYDVLIDQSIELDADLPEIGFKKGDKVNPPRGHGLGMANEVTTLAQCVIIAMAEEIMPEPPRFPITYDTWNDDFRAIGEKDDLIAYKDAEEAILESLGFIPAKEKTEILKGASVFLEEYIFDNDTTWAKEIRFICALVNILFASNIVEAKELYRSIYGSIDFVSHKELSKLAIFIIEKWGYEFNIAETSLPKTFGGWYECVYLWHDESFIGDKFFETSCNILMKLHAAEKTEVKPILRSKYDPDKFISKRIEDEFREITKQESALAPQGNYLVRNRRTIVTQVWEALSNRSLMKSYYKRLELARWKAYDKKIKGLLSHALVFSKVVKDYPERRYAIPQEFVKTIQSGGFTTRMSRTNNIFDAENYKIDAEYLQLQDKFLRFRDDLSNVEWFNLLFKSKLNYRFNEEYALETLFELGNLNKEAKIFSYEFNYAVGTYYYLEEYGGIPVELYADVDLPNVYDIYNIPKAAKDFLMDLQSKYPAELPAADIENINYCCRGLSYEVLTEIYESASALREEAKEQNKILKTVRTTDPLKLFELRDKVAKRPQKPESVQHETAAYDVDDIADYIEYGDYILASDTDSNIDGTEGADTPCDGDDNESVDSFEQMEAALRSSGVLAINPG